MLSAPAFRVKLSAPASTRSLMIQGTDEPGARPQGVERRALRVTGWHPSHPRSSESQEEASQDPADTQQTDSDATRMTRTQQTLAGSC